MDTTNELIDAFDELVLMFYIMMIITTSSYKIVNLNELEECVSPSLDTNVGIRDILHNMQTFLLCFKTNMSFTLTKFGEIYMFVGCTYYNWQCKSSGIAHVRRGGHFISRTIQRECKKGYYLGH